MHKKVLYKKDNRNTQKNLTDRVSNIWACMTQDNQVPPSELQGSDELKSLDKLFSDLVLDIWNADSSFYWRRSYVPAKSCNNQEYTVQISRFYWVLSTWSFSCDTVSSHTWIPTFMRTTLFPSPESRWVNWAWTQFICDGYKDCEQ